MLDSNKIHQGILKPLGEKMLGNRIFTASKYNSIGYLSVTKA